MLRKSAVCLLPVARLVPLFLVDNSAVDVNQCLPQPTYHEWGGVFKSAISPDSVTFDGSFISVAELRNLIAVRKGFGQDAGAELVLTNPSTKEDYTTDTQQIPRQTTVHVRRVATSKPRAIQSAAP